MYTKFKKINEGFTIVETLIVLAIAALIITIVLIAVPDLQRSSRNSDILHDAQNVASAVQTFEGNNNGELPAVPSTNPETGNPVTISNTGGASDAQSSAQVQSTDSVYFETSQSNVTYTDPTTAASSSALGPGDIVVEIGADCGATGTTNKPTADSRGVAVLYPIESGGSSGSVACIQE